MKNFFSYAVVPTLVLMPVVAFARFEEIRTFFQGMTRFIQETLIPLLLAIAFLVFIIGAVRFFLLAKEDADGRDKGKQLMLWGIIAFVIIVSIWGIVALISNGLGFDRENLRNVPDAPTIN